MESVKRVGEEEGVLGRSFVEIKLSPFQRCDSDLSTFRVMATWNLSTLTTKAMGNEILNVNISTVDSL